jgi:glutamate synthase domain-containing protein 3
VGTVAAGVAKGYADTIQISGFDGGTGASPLASIKHAGVPWELGLAETQQVLIENNLRGRVSLRVDGGMKTGRDVIVAALLGAEEYGFGTAALVAAGCAMIRQCHLNTCPVGVATQREDLRAKFPGTPEHVVNFLSYVAQQVRMILAELGARSLDEVIGRVDLLEARDAELPRAAKVDLSALLKDPDPGGLKPRRAQSRHNDRPDDDPPLDEIVWKDCETALTSRQALSRGYGLTNRERSVGARLAGEIARVVGPGGLPAGTLQLRFKGSAGQSFGAFCNSGMSLLLEGEAQDYVGKGMHGGEIAVFPPKGARFRPEDNAIIGNTVMYGATGGSLYAAGGAGERLAVRNSGGRVVVESCGDHGCEYMTGGVVVVLGRTGRNFGAGMSGGVAYVLDLDERFAERVNPGMVAVERVAHDVDEELLKALVARHWELTGSPRAAWVLEHWVEASAKFWKVVPHPGAEDKTAQEQDPKVFEAAVLAQLAAEAQDRARVESLH